MTRDAFIQKWLDSKKPYNDENRMAMLDDLDKVIARGMATDNTRLAELEAQGWKWWVEPAGKTDWRGCILEPGEFDGELMLLCDTKQAAEAACVEYLLNLNPTEQ
jgi:hypothetical protein